MLSNARQAVGRAVEPIAKAMVAAHLTANTITVLGLAGTIAAAVFVAVGRFGIGAAFFVPSAFLDLFDGLIARRLGTASPWGALIDSLSDRAGEGALLIAFSYRFRDLNPRLSVLAVSALVLSYLVSYVKARAESLGFRCEGGFAERPERAILYGTALLIVGAAEPAMWALALLAGWTAAQRILMVRAQARPATAVPPP
ncbi:MAG: CDP-alcohol phosphatidyltransferase family protein [Actinobacteria bacterium]|nr:MAG: CDP-alcohol phosphatidyltransferase family protein [Actinomycetota bacterium]